MMQNYVQPGEALTLTAPYAVSSGDGLLVGSLFGVACFDAANAATVEAQTVGVYTLAKATGETWSVGERIYWDDTNKECTTTSTSNTLIGVATAAAGTSATTGDVRLNGSF